MYHRISKLSLTNQPSYSVIVDSVDFKECYAYLSSLKYELTASRHSSYEEAYNLKKSEDLRLVGGKAKHSVYAFEKILSDWVSGRGGSGDKYILESHMFGYEKAIQEISKLLRIADISGAIKKREIYSDRDDHKTVVIEIDLTPLVDFNVGNFKKSQESIIGASYYLYDLNFDIKNNTLRLESFCKFVYDFETSVSFELCRHSNVDTVSLVSVNDSNIFDSLLNGFDK